MYVYSTGITHISSLINGQLLGNYEIKQSAIHTKYCEEDYC